MMHQNHEYEYNDFVPGFTGNGKEYYYNTETKETTYAKPQQQQESLEINYSQNTISEDSWETTYNDDGKEYYYNTETRETSWTKPLSLTFNNNYDSVDTSSNIVSSTSSNIP